VRAPQQLEIRRQAKAIKNQCQRNINQNSRLDYRLLAQQAVSARAKDKTGDAWDPGKSVRRIAAYCANYQH